MSSVDDRIVNMQFNNKQFETGVSTSVKSLDNLEKTLANTAKSKGLEGMAASVDKVSGRFSAMQVAGISAIATVASKATTAGINLVKSLTIDPILDGFREYQTGLDSIQTIMANTGESVKVVNAGLDKLNAYADQTIYNFGQMAKNVGTFTAAGVDLDTSIQSIKGIANLAALSGSSAEQASSAMYQLSQAIASGKVGLQDWNSVVNAGMGGKVFQTALARTAENMGTLEKGAVKLVGPMDKLTIAGSSFRESIQAGSNTPPWLTSEVLVDTLKQVAGGYSLAQLKSKGYSEQAAKDIIKMQKAAFEAATQIKTLPQLFGVIKESIGSSFSGIFRTVLGDFKQSKKLWTDVGFAIIGPQGFLTKAQDRLQRFFQIWADFGGRNIAIDAFKKTFESLGAIFSAVGKAYREVFPNADHNSLLRLTKGFHSLAVTLTPSEDTLKNLKNIFGGIFAVLHIGITIVHAIKSAFIGLLSGMFEGSGDARGGILSVLGSVGQLLMKVDKFLTSGGRMVDIFSAIGHAGGDLANEGLQMASNIIEGLMGGLGGQAVALVKKAAEYLAQSIPDAIKEKLGIHSPAKEMIPIGIAVIQGIVQGIGEGIKFIFMALGKIGGGIKDAFAQLFGDMDALQFASVLNAIFTGALILTLKNFSKSFSGIGDAIRGTFGQLTDTLKSMQQAVKAKMIRDIAIAVGVLTVSLIALTFIEPKKLAIALGAISVMLGTLVGSLAALSKISRGNVNMAILATSIVLISGAMVALAGAVAILGNQDVKTLVKGLGAMAIAMGIMVGALLALSKVSALAKGAGGAMVLMAVAMNILAGAIFTMGSMNVKTLAKGLGAMGVGLGLFTAALVPLGLIGKGVLSAGAAIVLMAGAMVILSAAVLAFGHMGIKTMVKGFAAIAIGLGLFVLSLKVLGANLAGTLAAAGAMVLMATAMGMLVPVILTLGSMDMGMLAKGLGALAIMMGIFVVAVGALGAIALIVGPGLLMLGGALALVGIGMLAFGAGFALMAAAGVAGVAVLTAGFTALMMLLPSFAMQIAAAFVTFLQTIAAASPKIREAFATIFRNVIGVIRDVIPDIRDLLMDLITAGISVLRESIPQWVEMGFTIIDEFLRSAADHAPDIIDSVNDLIVAFIQGLDNSLQEIIEAGTDLIVHFIEGIGAASLTIIEAAAETMLTFLHGLDDAIVRYSQEFRDVGLSIAGHIVDGLTGGLAGNVAGVVGDAVGVAGNVVGALNPFDRRASGTSAKQLTPAQSVASAIKLANALIANGDRTVLKAQKEASDRQRAADAAQAKVDATRQAAQKLRKTDPKEAKKLQALAEKQQKAAEAAQTVADRAAQHVADVQQFQQADLHGKGEIKNQQAVALSDRASEMLAKANAEAAQAKDLMKSNKKAGLAMLAQAKKDAQEAKKLAEQAQASHAAANQFYAQEVNERIKQLEADRKADEKAIADQEAYDAADTAGKAKIMEDRAAADQLKADKAEARAAALIEEAKKLALTDAAKAMALLDKAEAQAQIAKDAAAQAKQEKEQAAQLLQQGVTSPTATSIQPSRSILDNAASAVDSYTSSLQQASELAAAQQQVIQYTQNNYSPEALSASEIYRNSKNLISAAEVKMGSDSSN